MSTKYPSIHMVGVHSSQVAEIGHDPALNADAALSALSAGLERTRITESELTVLIRASSRDHVVECAYGPGWTDLLPTRQNRWAFEALLVMRSNVELNGERSESARTQG